MNRCSTKHGRNILCDLFERHDWSRVLLRRMGERFKDGERFLVGELQDLLMGSDDLKIEGGHLVEEVFGCSKPGGMSRLIAKRLSNGFGCLCHEDCSLLSCSLDMRRCECMFSLYTNMRFLPRHALMHALAPLKKTFFPGASSFLSVLGHALTGF